MYININHNIRISHINSELVNTIYNFKEKTKTDNTSSCLDIHMSMKSPKTQVLNPHP